MARGEKLLKLWNDWSSGIGYLRDDGTTPGMYYASSILGGYQDLRPAPLKNDCDHATMTTETDLVMTYAFDESYSSTVSFLYAICNSIAAATNEAEIVKIQLDNANFATVTKTESNVAYALTVGNVGQPTRYQGNWHFSDTDEIYELATVAAAGTNDSWSASNDSRGCNHLTMLNHQVVKAKAGSGVSILAEDAAPTTGTWGSYFSCGDKSETPAAIFTVSGLTFVLKKSGLYTFGVKNDRTVSGQINEDFGRWRAGFDNLPCVPWKGGEVIAHPYGLVYYTPGEPFTPIGIETKPELSGICPSGVTELEIGRYHGVAVAGDYIYVINQPDPDSTAALVLVGHAPGAFPSDISWQCISSLTLKGIADNAVHGIHATALGFPDDASERNPTVWFSDATNGNENLSYLIVDSRGQPLRGRANTHKVVLSGDAFMSEIIFETPVDLRRVVIYSDDMTDGDEWQISAIVNDTGNDVNVGAPIIGSGRHERPFERHSIYRFTLHVKWVATSTSARAAPTIRRIELWGTPYE